jgi:hypothetical protein
MSSEPIDGLSTYLLARWRLFQKRWVVGAMEQIRIRRRRSVRRAEEIVAEPLPVEPVVRTDDAADLIARIDELLDH